MVDGQPPLRDERRPPFCYQTHDALDAIRAYFDRDDLGFKSRSRTSTAISIYVSFTEAANRYGGAAARGGFEATRDQVAEGSRVSTDTFDWYVPHLEACGVLARERQQIGNAHLPNRWVLLDPSRARSATPSRAGAATLAEPARRIARASSGGSKKGKNPPGGALERVAAPGAVEPSSGGGNELVAYFVDEARRRGVDPTRNVIGQMARYAKGLLDEGRSADEIRAGIDRMLDRRVVQPAMLANFVTEAALPRSQSRSDHVDPGDILRRAAEERRREFDEEERG